MPAWITNHIHCKLSDEITYPFPKLKRCNRWSLWMDKWFNPTFYYACNYLSMLGLQLFHISKKGPWFSITRNHIDYVVHNNCPIAFLFFLCRAVWVSGWWHKYRTKQGKWQNLHSTLFVRPNHRPINCHRSTFQVILQKYYCEIMFCLYLFEVRFLPRIRDWRIASYN